MNFVFVVKLTSVISQGSYIYTFKETYAEIFLLCVLKFFVVSIADAWSKNPIVLHKRNGKGSFYNQGAN